MAGGAQWHNFNMASSAYSNLMSDANSNLMSDANEVDQESFPLQKILLFVN